MNVLRWAALACAAACVSPLAAAAAPEPAAAVPRAVAAAVTHHTVRVRGRSIAYTATAGTIDLTDAKDEPTARMFYVAYVADGFGAHEKRPLAFLYNGGPGSSSALVHMGAFGPRTVVTANGAPTRPAPYDLVDNEDSLLPASDLVFVDAVGTGYSRLVGSGTAKDYYGVDQDGRAFAQFVRRYIAANDRWNSPKYLAGESYGTTRSAVLAKLLQDESIALNGIVLISTVLDFETLEAQPANDQFYELLLPTEAATAAYHHRIAEPADRTAFLREVRAFAQGPYARALFQGAALPDAERDAVARELHGFIGLPVDYLVRSRLRVPPERFEKELLGPSERSIGRLDGRFSGSDVDPVASDVQTEPSVDAFYPALAASVNRYLRDELRYRPAIDYRLSDYPTINANWDYAHGGSGLGDGATTVSADLRDAMTANAFLRVYAANGLYDLATPFFATEFSLSHLGLAPALQPHVKLGYYASGHLIYLDPQAHAALTRDMSAFIEGSR